MIEFITNQTFHLIVWLSLAFFSLAAASVAMSLFIFYRKYQILINAVILYIFFYFAFSQYLKENEEMIKAFKTSGESMFLSINNTLVLIFSSIGILVFGIISLIQSTKGFFEARADIIASVKALIPPNSIWKPEQGLTECIIKKYRITEAEQAVANLALLGKSNKEISRELNKAVGTVEAQLKSIYQKTEVPGRYALLALVANSITEA
ncbi:MAG: helix-turn-helix transcriptional regulator [Treponema sp.]|nr:helix-turn-helix transcriptional regulator [Treponema sp.]